MAHSRFYPKSTQIGLLPFPSTTRARGSLTHEYPVLFLWHLRSPSPVLLTLQPHFLTHTMTVFTTQYSLLPSQTHTPSHLFPLSLLPHHPPLPYINRTGIPIPVRINNRDQMSPGGVNRATKYKNSFNNNGKDRRTTC